MYSGIQWRAGGVLFLAALLLSAEALAAPQSAAHDIAGHGWPQTPASPSGIATPAIGAGQRLIRFNGRALDAAGKPVAGMAGVTFAIYEEQSGGAPLWQETQNLTTEADGRFSALLGATSATGIDPELFASGESRWLAVLTNAPGAVEQPRVLLVSVPFALRSADSEMLGGKPASAYMTASASTATQGSCVEPGIATTGNAVRKAAAAAIAASSPTLGYVPYFYDAGGAAQSRRHQPQPAHRELLEHPGRLAQLQLLHRARHCDRAARDAERRQPRTVCLRRIQRRSVPRQ